MKKSERIAHFLHFIDSIISENEYYDEEKGIDCCGITENEVYERAFSTFADFHFIGTDFAKDMIHVFCTNFPARIALLKAYDVL